MDEQRAAGQIENGLVPLDTRAKGPPQRATLAARMAHYGVPGVSIALIEGGTIAWARGYGVRSAGSDRAVTPGTRFQAASISKPVAALAALRLVERGAFALDDDVNTLLRSWRIPANEDWQPRVTVRHLLSHTAGLTVHGFPGYPRAAALPALAQILDGVPPANTPPIRVDTVPGAQFRYSGGGYCVLQQLLCDATGQPFPALMRDLVLAPLRMAHSDYTQPPTDATGQAAASGHLSGNTPIAGGWHCYPEQAAAGLWTTPTDLARFAIAVQQAIAGGPDALLAQPLAQAMITPALPDAAMRGQQIGLGLFLQGAQEHARFGHGGSNAGFRCELVADARGGQGAVVMTNGDDGDDLAHEILWAVAETYDWRGYHADQPPPLVIAPETSAAYVGTYEVRPGFAFAVAYDRGLFTIQPTGQAPLVVVPRTETAFFHWRLDATWVFAPDAESLTFQQNGRDLRARRVRGRA